MKIIISTTILILLSLSVKAGNDSTGTALQIAKEKAFVDTLKIHMSCKSIKGNEDGNLYCNVSFRGLNGEITGANKKGGGTIYINSIG